MTKEKELWSWSTATRRRHARLLAALAAATALAGVIVATAAGDPLFGGGSNIHPGNLLIARSVYATPNIVAGAMARR